MTTLSSKINGRKATVSYLNDAFEPVPAVQATQLKIAYEDNNEVMFLRTRPKKLGGNGGTLRGSDVS